MVVITSRRDIPTKGQLDIIDITGLVQEEVHRAGVRDGCVTVFVPGSTAAVTTMEYEPGLVADIRRTLSMLIPEGDDYEHHRRWGDHNGHSHVRASFLGPSLSVPIVGADLVLGRWQQIVLLELDVRARRRTLVLQVMGETAH